ncbi:MAG TPA: lmo0937 family membrane protein [Phenylobacterium sp.]|nr:lmo0937 family membrane protein [Phenylobacterium sp.]
MLLIIAVVLVALWLLGFLAFHVTTAAIHIILLIALVMVVLHFVRGRRTL